MERKYLIIILLLIICGCERNKEAEIPRNTEPPKSVTVLRGNNQKGYPNYFLSDTIVLEIIPANPEDIDDYSYSFKSAEYYPGVTASDTVVNNKLYIRARWKLNSASEQKLTCYIEEKCDQQFSHINCTKLDSVEILATLKKPWKRIFTGDSWPLHDMHFRDENNGIVVGDLPFTRGYLKTKDGGQTWSYADNYRNDLYQLSFSHPDTGIVIVTNNYAYFTNNGGETFFQGEWTPSITGHGSSSDYFLFNSKKMITVGVQGSIAKTIDGGKTWTRYQGFTFKNHLYDITCTDDKTCYACGSIGKVIKTTDAGESWKEYDLLLNNYLKTIYFIDNNLGFAAGQYGAFVRTTDGGATWQIIQTGLKTTIIEIFFNSGNEGYIVSQSGEIGRTTNGGVTWEMLNMGNYGVYDLTKAFFKKNSILGLQGGSIYKYDLSDE